MIIGGGQNFSVPYSGLFRSRIPILMIIEQQILDHMTKLACGEAEGKEGE